MKKKTLTLPEISGKGAPTEYFPTKMQAFIFRNWELVSKEKIAAALKTTVLNVEKQAYKMGLLPQGDVSEWMTRGYISIIKLNWDLIPYNQLLELLGWEEDRLSVVLKEEDFLDCKLGNKKPECGEIEYRELSAEEEEKTEKIRELILRHFPSQGGGKKPFAFFEQEKKEPVAKTGEVWEISDLTGDKNVFCMLSRFSKKIENTYGVSFRTGAAKKITVEFFSDEKEEEYHEIITNESGVKIIAADSGAVMRALVFLEDIINLRGGMNFDKKTYKRSAKFKTRFIYSFCGLYNDALDVESEIFCPDELLESYAAAGINGIWIQAVLYMLTEFPFEPEISKGWEIRLKNLKKFSDRAQKYGIKIYLYINEPRGMSLNFFEKYPELLGNKRGNTGCLCTSTEPVKKYLADGITRICEAVPELGGFFTITRSENITNCYSLTCEMTCPRCKDRKHYEVIAEVNSIIAESAAAVNPKIRVFAWNWGWKAPEFMTAEDINKCIDLMPENVILLSPRETGLPTEVGGIKNNVVDYTVSVKGVSDEPKEEWAYAISRGHEAAAKLQINNSWECSTIPYLPVFELIEDHVSRLEENGVSHLMLSWTLGGYPSPNIKIASKRFFQTEGAEEGEDIYKSMFGENAEVIKKASAIFSEAFTEYPFDCQAIYLGPANGGISNPIYLKPTGKAATMTCFAYDDLEQWRSLYPEDIYENQYKKMCDKWEEGLKLLDGVDDDFCDVAKSTYIQLKSSYNQIRFIRIREDIKNKEEMIELLNSEIKMAEEMYVIMQKDPCVGFEAANHYYYTQGMIMEKAVNCENIISELNNR